MTLKEENYLIYENKLSSKVRLIFELSEIPSGQWVKCFNNKTETIKACNNSVYLILEDYAMNIQKNVIVSQVLSIIKDVDEDIYNGTVKEQVLSSLLKVGTITVYDGLSCLDGSLQDYLNKINNKSVL